MTDERSLLLAIDNHETLFGLLDEQVDARDWFGVFKAIDGQTSQSSIAEDADTSQSTVSRVLQPMQEAGLVEKDQGGEWQKTIECLSHPLMEELWKDWNGDNNE